MDNDKNNNFGSSLRDLRHKSGYSIKGLAKHINVNYSYLSKIENGHSTPSEKFIDRIADFFNYDKEELMVRAGKIPEDIVRIISDNPTEAIKFLREEFE